MESKNEIHVKIGEVKVGRVGDLLKATLGSCVGIAFLWKEKGVCGLAHCLLPESHENTNMIGAKFVNQAIPSLMVLLKIKPENISEIEVHIAGGGNMMFQLSQRNIDHVGKQNVTAAQNKLKELGFKIKTSDVGGDEGRQIYVDCSSGDVRINRLQKIDL